MRDSQLPLKPERPWKKPISPDKYTPSHPQLFRVEFASSAAGTENESFSSRLVAVKSFLPDTVICKLENLSQAPDKAYSSVQFGPGCHDHFELNSDLLFLNHSCEPSVILDVSGGPEEWCLRTTSRGLQPGEELTFFYPSTEWDMAQRFTCACRAQDCLGQIQGAKYLSLTKLKEHSFVNAHISKLKRLELQGQSAS